MAYLDRLVVGQFEGKRFSIPATVYARPLELFSGKAISRQAIIKELETLDYANATQVHHPGEYKQSANTIELFVRPFSFWDGKQKALHLRLFFSSGTLTKLIEIASGDTLDLVRLDPVKIGGIYPNHGEDRALIRLKQAPEHLVNALIAIEDKRFYQHYGVDPKAILRALTTIVSGKRIQGGSTITQQLVKNFFLTPERSIQRKINEMIMAVLLELHYDKHDILETYLNEVYFGQDRNRAIHGAGLASQFFFSRSVEHLELHQSALLVGLLKGPAYYNPRKHPKRAQTRRNLVLEAMHEQGLINDYDFNKAKQKAVHISALPNRGQSPYPAFMDLVIRQLKRDYRESDLRSEGLQIFTSLDPSIQASAEYNIRQQLNRLEHGYSLAKDHLQAAFIIANVHDGEIQALIGDRNTHYQGFNRALDASRQIGSLIKPAIYLTALEKTDQYHLASTLDDSPFTWKEPGIEDWQPENYSHDFYGNVALWKALASSYNVSAARLGTTIGVDSVMRTVQKLGIRKSLPNYASGLLGTVHLSPYEVTQMYHTIANDGFHSPLKAIREVVNQQGEPLRRYPVVVSPAISRDSNTLVVAGLQKVVSHGTAKYLQQHMPNKLALAGKTGTTDKLRDSWFAGFSGNKVAVAWIGNDDNLSIKLSGATGALKLWSAVMQPLTLEPVAQASSENIEWLGVDKDSGFLTSEDCHTSLALPFIKGSVDNKVQYCGRQKQSKIKSWIKGLFGD
ncbi:MAG: penicillin-binding protein 1B [Agarilytica sp.]